MQEGHHGVPEDEVEAWGPNLPEDPNLPSSPESSRRRSQTVSASPWGLEHHLPCRSASSCCTPHPVPTTSWRKEMRMPVMYCQPWRRWSFSGSLPHIKKLWKLIRGSRKARRKLQSKKEGQRQKADLEECVKSRDEDNDEMRKGWRRRTEWRGGSGRLRRVGETPRKEPAKTWDTFVQFFSWLGRVVLAEEPEKVEIKTELSSGLSSKPGLPRLRASEQQNQVLLNQSPGYNFLARGIWMANWSVWSLLFTYTHT